MKNSDVCIFGVLAAIVLGTYLVFAVCLVVNLQTVYPNVLSIVSSLH